MSNPLLGRQISLVSKKNIRYEGTLYSINETDATVALKNVRSFGTEGREKSDANTTFVPPQDAVHPYLLFRGCDIKDLHVHETKDAAEAASKPKEPPQQPQPAAATTTAPATDTSPETPAETQPPTNKPKSAPKASNRDNRRSKKNTSQVGTGASLLNRKARGTVEGAAETPKDDFDFESNLANFDKEEEDYDDGEDEPSYAKDDFFDSISCDALDKQSGVDNRLRGSAERNLNTETFGAVALNHRRRRYRGRGRGGGRGRGRGRGRGGSGRGEGSRPRENNRWRKDGSEQFARSS